MTSRRRFLGLTAGAVVLGTSGFVVVNRPSASGLLRSARPLPEPFTVPLPIPSVARPVRTEGRRSGGMTGLSRARHSTCDKDAGRSSRCATR
jgi:hypothetical protein